MINEEQVKGIIKKVLDEEHLTGFIKIFEKEHNLFRGSHDKIGLPENLEIPEKIITQIIQKGLPVGSLTGDLIQYDAKIEEWKRIPALTQGSIVFAGANGYFTEDKANLFWNDTLNVLEVLAPTGNTYIGKGVVGAGNSTGVGENVYVGCEAGHDSLEAARNVLIGYWAGYKHTSGLKNTIVGYYAGHDITTSQLNTLIGAGAGKLISTGQGQNTLIGLEAGASITIGIQNVGVGVWTLTAIDIGSRNTCIGYDAEAYHPNSQYRIAIGHQATSKEDNLCAIGGPTSTNSVNLAIFCNREFRFYDAGADPRHLGFKAPTLEANQIWVLPAVDADAVNKCLKSDSAGNLGWSQQLGIGNAPTFATLFLASIKSGANQAAAGAIANELWKTSGHATLPDNVVMIGV